VPATARLFAEPGRAVVLCGRDAPAARRRALERRGVTVVALARRGGHLPLRAALERLAGLGLGTVLVEGGGALGAALLRARLVDELVWVSAPVLLGADARPALGPLGLARLAAAPRLQPRRIRRLGPDLWIEAAPSGGGR
jgi:diaminohydroxyphosphoribosylaminopyrimidine deaminase/5-amino-6-(5-phosphoribosylamino)uracil reductase